MKRNIIRQIYLYAVSIISLFMVVFSTSSLLKLGLQTWVFPKAGQPYNNCGTDYGSYPAAPMAKPAGPGDVAQPQMTDEQLAKQKAECLKNQDDQRAADTQQQLVQNISILIVTAPLFWFHFKLVQKEREEDKEMMKDAEKKA